MSDDNKGLFDKASLPLMSFSSVLCGLVISKLDCQPKNTHQRDKLNNIRASLKRLKQNFNQKNLEDLIQHVCGMLVATDEEETTLDVSSSDDLSDDVTMTTSSVSHDADLSQHNLRREKIKSILKNAATSPSQKEILQQHQISQGMRTNKNKLSNSNFVLPENRQFSSVFYQKPHIYRNEYSESEIDFHHSQKKVDREKTFNKESKGESPAKNMLQVLFSESEENFENKFYLPDHFQIKPTSFYSKGLDVSNKIVNFEDFVEANSKATSKKLNPIFQENFGYTKKAAYRAPNDDVKCIISSKKSRIAEEAQNDEKVISSLKNVLYKLKQLNKNFQ